MREEKKQSNLRFFWQILVILLAVFVLRTYVIGAIMVKGSSMEPTLHHGDFAVVNKITYRLGEPKRNDIAICGIDSGGKEENLIKRVIGLPGDEIVLKEKTTGSSFTYELYRNGELLEEDYIREPMQQWGNIQYPYIVPEGHYFVMGDNRNASTDSREQSVGSIEKKNMVGKAIFRVYPFDTITVIK